MRTDNQIDHILISRNCRISLLDVRNQKGPDIASDHQLLVGDLTLKLTRAKKPGICHRTKFNIENLKTLSRLRNLKQNLRGGINQQNNDIAWEDVNGLITQTAQSTLGTKLGWE